MAEPLKNQGLGVVVGAVVVALVAGAIFLASRTSPPAQAPVRQSPWYPALLKDGAPQSTYDAKQAQMDYIQQQVDDIHYKQMYPTR